MPQTTKNTLIWLAIAFGMIILGYAISTLISILLMRRSQKKAFKALDDLVPYEKERFEKIREFAQFLIAENRLHKGSILDSVEEQKALFEKDTVDMNKAKAVNDFLVMYFAKYIKEKNLKKKEPYNSWSEFFENDVHIDLKDKANPYAHYDKLAMRYNSYLGMMLVGWYARRKNYPQAPIL